MFDLSTLKSGPIVPITARHGVFLTLKGDTHGPGGCLRHYGEFCEHEIDLLTDLIERDSFVIEVGANIGTHAVPLIRRMAAQGVYVAYEPQPILATLLEANLALNNFVNVDIRIKAAGSSPGYCEIPIVDYTTIGNAGAVSLAKNQHGGATPTVTSPARETGFVPVEPLDAIPWGKKVDLIKIDAEEMEHDVLRGSQKIVSSDRPLIYFEEHQLSDVGKIPLTAPMKLLRDCEYRLYGHSGSLHRENNFFNQRQPLFSDFGGSSNVLAIPSENHTNYLDHVRKHRLNPIDID